MNIFSKSAKKSLVWKTINVLVVFSLVSSYALPLVPTVRAEEGVDVAVSDSPSVESSESNDENRDDAEVSEENGSSEETSEETASEDEVTDDTSTEVEVTDDTSEEESGGGSSSNEGEESPSEETPGEEVLGESNPERTNEEGSSSNNSPETGENIRVPKTFESADEEAYYENSQIAETVKCDDSDKDNGCNPIPQTGSIRVCKVTVDEKGDLNTENIVDGATFTIEGNSASTIQFGLPTGTIPTSTFDTPLTLNEDLFGDDKENDAECITYTGLSLANPGYYYKNETISPVDGWDAPKFNDQFGISYVIPEGADFDMDDYYVFSGELFDEVGANDEDRNEMADGHITLSPNRPDRTILVVNRYVEPENQCEEATFSVVSDTTATVVENANANAVATTTHPAWTALIPGATWIWETIFVVSPTQNETKTFEKTFNVDGAVLDADLSVAADNQYRVWINGNLIGEDATEFNYSAAGQDQYNDISSAYFVDGQNTLKMEVTNMAGDQNPENNPAGALFKLDLKTEDCGGNNQCSEKIMARVVVTDVQNIGAGGNITSDVYVGGNTPAHKYASGEWFEIYDGTNWITDPNIATFHNVPGLAIRRMDGKIHVRDIGPFIYANPKPTEHIEGYIEFQNASALSQENDLVAPVEHFSNNIKLIKDTEDEIWIDGGKSYFWMTTSTGNDGFYTNISEPIVDDCSEPTPFCGDGIVNQTSEQCDAGPNGSQTCTNTCQNITQNPVCNPEIELITNGSFEDVAVASGWDIVNSGTTGLGWLVDWVASAGTTYGDDTIPTTASLELHRGVNGWLPSGEGYQYAELDGDWEGPTGNTSNEPASTRISQTIPTVVGQVYTISADYSGRPGTDATQNQLGFKVDGVLIAPGAEPEDNSSGTQTDWRTVTRIFTATSVSTTVSLEDMGTSDSVGTFVDNVSVTCTDETPDLCGNGNLDEGEACDGGEDCTEQCTIDNGGNGGELETCGDGFVDEGEQCDAGPGGSSTCSTSCTVIDNNGGGGSNEEEEENNGGGGSSSGSRSSSGGGEVLGAKTTDGEVLGETLAQTGVDFSPISFFALVALALFVIARRKEDKKLA
jgi:hypothetical protein